MAFWSRKPKADGSDYVWFAQKQLKAVTDTMDLVERHLERNGDPQSVAKLRPRLVKAIEEMRALPITAEHRELAAKHKSGYLTIMELQLRKMDALLQSDWSGLEALAEEEERLAHQTTQEAARVSSDLAEMKRNLGIS